MHIRLTTPRGAPHAFPRTLLGTCRLTPGERGGAMVVVPGDVTYAVREDVDEILALLAAVPPNPSRLDSTDAEKLAAGWRQERLRNGPHDDEHPTWTAGDPAGLRRWRVADGWLGEWHLHASGCWVRWLVVVTP